MTIKKRKSQIWKSKKIDKIVYTRWINNKLQSINKVVADVQHDLSDGAILIDLIELLSLKKLQNIKLPTDDRQNKISNISNILSFLQKEEISLIAIDSIDIIDGSLEKIKELIWALIFHYSIKKSILDNAFIESGNDFLKWINSKLDEYEIDNFTSSWSNGIAIGVLVNLCDKDICTDVLHWNVDNTLNNANFAMEAALQCLKVPLLLKPLEITSGEVSERAVMIYLSQFIYLLQDLNINKKGGTVEDAGNTSTMFAELPVDHSMQIADSAYRVRIKEQEPLYVNTHIHILVTIPREKIQSSRNLVVEVVNHNGSVFPCTQSSDNTKSDEVQFSFVPNLSESYEVFVRNNEKNILTKSLKMNILPRSKSNEIMVYGPGLSCAMSNQPGVFIIETKGVNQQIGFSMEGPSKTIIQCIDLGDAIIKISYLTFAPGVYQLSIGSNDLTICGSPYRVNVTDFVDTQEIQKIRVTGLQDQNLSNFIIDARNTGFTDIPDVQCYDKFGTDLENIAIKELEAQRFQIEVAFRNVDRFIIFAGFDHVQIEGFPFKVNQNAQNDDANDANKSTDSPSFHEKCLTILNQGLVDAIDLSIQNLCVDTLKDIVISKKFETNLCISESVKSEMNSGKKDGPMANFDSFKWVDGKFGINLYGVSLKGCPVKTGESQIITVDLKKSLLDGELGIALEGPSDTEVKCFDNGDGICIIKYQPTKHGRYELIINFNEQPIGGSPFTILVADNLDQIQPSCDNVGATPKVKNSSPNVTEKLENTLNTCDNGSISSFNVDSLVQNIVKSKVEDDQTISVDQTSPELINSNEIDSIIGSSSNASGYSIMSGVYKAKIKKIFFAQTLPFVQNFNSAIERSKSDKSTSSQSLSTSMEIEKISQNYNELLLSFYGNMISAFTNLAIIEIILISIEKSVNLIVSKTQRLNSIPITKYKRKHVEKLPKKNHQNFHNNQDDVFTFFLTNTQQIHSKPLDIKPRSAAKVSSVKSSRPSRKINSFNETIDLFVNNSIRRVSSLNHIHFPPNDAISSFEVRDCKNKIENISTSVSEFNNTLVTNWDHNNKRTFYSPSDALTFTKNSLVSLEECCKSVGVDVASSSNSSNQLPMRESFVQGTDAEVVFDSSFVESNQMSSYISVFDKGLVNDEILKSDFSIDFEGYSKAIDSCKSCFDDYRETKSRDRASTSDFSKINSFKECMSETIKESNSSTVNRQNLITGLHNIGDDSVVSCHYFEIPLTLRSHAKRTKKHEWRTERQCKTVDGSQSTLNYITEVIQSSLINPGYNTVEHTMYCSQSDMEKASTLYGMQENQLIPNNGLSIDDEIQSLIVTRSLENELQVNIGLEHCKVRNIARVSMSLPIFHQFRCRDKRFNMKQKTIVTNANEIILMETVQFCTSQMHQCLKSNSNRYELYKKEEKTVKERSAQTSMFVQEPKVTGEVSSIMIPNVDRSQNKAPINVPSLSCSNNCPVLGENHKLCQNESAKWLHNFTPIQEASSNESQDISSAVETLVDAITDIAKNHLILHPSKGNIKRVEELVQLLPRLLKFGKEKRLYQINYLTDKLESILLQNHDQNSKKALGQIIQCIKHCVSIDINSLKEKLETDCGLKKKINRKTNVGDDKDVLEDIIDDGRKVEKRNPIDNEVHVVGQALHEGVVDENNKFVVHTNAKMPGNLSICFEGPSKAEITFVDQKIGIYIVSYKVTLPGEYFCSIRFNQHNISQSPFRILITQSRLTNLDRNETSKSKSNSQLQLKNKTKNPIMLPVGRNIMFHIRSLSISNLNCFVTGPTGTCTYIPIEQISSSNRDGVLSLFTSHVGVYTLDFYNSTGDKIDNSWTLNITNDRGSLKASTIHCNMDINEANQKSTMELTEMHHNICAYGDGLERARVNQKTFFYIFIRNHSENLIGEDPSLDVTIDGPSKVNISCVEDTNGYTFCYIPVIPGIYFIGIRYTGQFHIHGSPFKVIVLS